MERQALGKRETNIWYLPSSPFTTNFPRPNSLRTRKLVYVELCPSDETVGFRLLFQFYQIVQLLGRRRYSYESGKRKKADDVFSWGNVVNKVIMMKQR